MPRPLDIALQEIGVKEIVGEKHNAKVIEYFAKARNSWVKDDETAWCAAFVAYCLEEAGLKSTRKLNARSYLEWGEETTSPKLGDLVVFWRGSKSGALGHVGFFIADRDDKIQVLGGNQDNAVNIAGYAKSRVLSYRTSPIFNTALPTSKSLTNTEALSMLLLALKHFKK